MTNKPIVSTINKWIWVFPRYYWLLLYVNIKGYWVRYTNTRSFVKTIRYQTAHTYPYIADLSPSTETRKASKRDDPTPSKPTTRIPSRVKISICGSRIYHLINKLSWRTSPIQQYLQDKGFEITSNPDEADIIIITHAEDINTYQNKKIFMLNLEPFWSQFKNPLYTINNQPLLISDCHVNSLLTSNYANYPYHHINPDVYNLHPIHFSDIKNNWHRRNKVATLLSFYTLKKEPVTSLRILRRQIALYGRAMGITDIKGPSWPAAIVSKEKIHLPKEIEYPGWFNATEKVTWLRQGFLFNLCFENSNIPYYVTEKLWQAFTGYTLPIYYSNDTIYETFPKGSFIDYRDFKNKAQLYQYILDMPADEYLDRLNLGIEFVSRYKEHIAEFQRWQKTARQHVYANLVRLHAMK